MKTYETILLDWDGNLAKTLDVWMHATRAPLEKRGIYLTDLEIALKCFGHVHESFEELGIADIQDAVEEMVELAGKLLPEVELYPDALFVLEDLKNDDKKTALITTSHHKSVVPLLDKYNVHKFFDVVITHDDVTHHKPHAEPLEKALEHLGASKETAIMIGDSDKDIGAAKNAGVDSILFYPDEHKRFYKLEDLQAHDPTYTISDFRKVIDIVSPNR